MVNAWPVASESVDSGHSRSTSERSEGRMQAPVDAGEWAETFGMNRSPSGMDERLAESMPSPGPAPPGRVAGPGCRAATVAGGRRETETGVARWRKCASWMQGGPTDGKRKPACGRAGGRTRDARGAFSQQTTSLDHYYPGNRAKLTRFRAKLTSCRIASAPPNQHSCIFIRAKQACYCAK